MVALTAVACSGEIEDIDVQGPDAGGYDPTEPEAVPDPVEGADPGQEPMAPLDCALAVPPATGYVRKPSPTVFSEVEKVSPSGSFWSPFPYSGQFGRIFTRQDETITLRFDTPSDVAMWAGAGTTKAVFWDESQVDGAADLNFVYVTLSTCPGDFRVPPSGPATASDPTFARGCTNVREFNGSLHSRTQINYEIGAGVATDTTCMLAPGRTYYLNFVRARATDGSIGSPEDEVRTAGDSSSCKNPQLESCGVQMRVE